MSFHERDLQLNQLDVVTAAYNALSSGDVQLPPPHSILPALLSLRNTVKSVECIKDSIKETTVSIERGRINLEEEKLGATRAQNLNSTLQARVEKLRLDMADVALKTDEELAREVVQEHSHRQDDYNVQQRRLVERLNAFIDDHLAQVIAAKDVGRFADNPHGQEESLLREKRVAGADFRKLLEDLLNAAADIDDPNPYVTATRDSASARFAIRAKLATTHPEDASKLRLLDFGIP